MVTKSKVVASIIKSTAMKKLTNSLLKLSGIVLSSTILFFSCGPAAEQTYNSEEKAKLFADSISSLIQNSNHPKFKTDSNRAFVRTANLSFKVKDVKLATFDIEQIVTNHNGYLTSSDLISEITYKNSIRVSQDSMLDITNYNVHSDIIMRIPNIELDKTLAEIATLIDYLDYRKIKADDVTKEFQTAKLAEHRFTNHRNRLEKMIDEKGKNINQIAGAENDLLIKQECADNSKLQTMELVHDVSYSTISIKIYQKETTKKEAYAYTFPSEPYKPTFSSKFLMSLSDGASIFGEIILFFVKLWPVALVLISILFLIKLVLRQKWVS